MLQHPSWCGSATAVGLRGCKLAGTAFQVHARMALDGRCSISGTKQYIKFDSALFLFYLFIYLVLHRTLGCTHLYSNAAFSPNAHIFLLQKKEMHGLQFPPKCHLAFFQMDKGTMEMEQCVRSACIKSTYVHEPLVYESVASEAESHPSRSLGNFIYTARCTMRRYSKFTSMQSVINKSRPFVTCKGGSRVMDATFRLNETDRTDCVRAFWTSFVSNVHKFPHNF